MNPVCVLDPSDVMWRNIDPDVDTRNVLLLTVPQKFPSRRSFFVVPSEKQRSNNFYFYLFTIFV